MIGVLIVTWNRKADLLDCVRSVLRSDYPDFSVYVVDNASSDGTSDAVASQFPQVSLIRSEENLGFAAGNNLGLKRMLHDGVDAAFLLNDDAVIAEDTLSSMLDSDFRRPDVGVAAPKILLHSDPGTVWSAGGLVDPRTGIAVQRFYGEPDDGRADQPAEIEYAVGCAMLIKADVVREAGMLDPDYYMYYEEADWCRRIRACGYRILYVPRSRVRHKVELDRSVSDHAVYYYARNRLLYLSRSGAGPSRIAWVTVAGVLRSALGHAAHGRIRESRLMVRGIADYYAKRLGRLEQRK